MNIFHREILSEIKQNAAKSIPDRDGFGINYVGSDKPYYHLNTKTIRQIIRTFLRNHKDLSLSEQQDLITSLYKGSSYEEVIIAGLLVGSLPRLRSSLDLNLLDEWLDHTYGWAEVDTLCSMAFTDTDLLENWENWHSFLSQLSKDINVHKRRASLVLLVKPVRFSDDPKLSGLAFKNVNLLKSEKDIRITKAVSWILRALIKNHKAEVSEYLGVNQDTLPKIAVREVRSKLETGKKYINSKSKLK